MKDFLEEEFEKIYGKSPAHFYFSPGRVNLIGEHIDYNGGLVMPCAITFGTWLLLSFNKNDIFRFRSLNFEDQLDTPVQSDYQKIEEYWFNYPLGIIQYFLNDGCKLSGIDLLFFGNIPIGSGLSSSASIEVVTAFALNDLFKTGYDKLDLVKLSKQVENKFIGVKSGIMDQFAVAFGEKNKALMLNCNTLDYQAVNADLGDYLLAIVNTNKPRKLSESKYNERVEECKAALAALNTKLQISHLCDIDTATFEDYSYLIEDETVKKRARHVITENERVKLAAVALKSEDLMAFGKLMYASHDSLRDLYEVSGKELDAVAAYCKTDADVAGARMTGAGFGGCAIALVKSQAFERFINRLTDYYTEKIGYAPTIYKSLIGDGVKTV